MQTLKKIFDILSLRERKHLLLLLVLILVMAIMEMIGIASILPFVAVLTNQDLIDTNFFLNTMFDYSNNFGVNTKSQFLIILGLAVFILFFISLTLKCLVTYAQSHFTSYTNYNIAKRLVETYLNQPYNWFLNRHSADLGKNILTEVSQVMRGLNAMIIFITNSILVIIVIFLLFLTNLKITFIIFFIVGGTYFLIFKTTKHIVLKMGQKRLRANKWIFQVVNELFGAAKEVKLGDLEIEYTKRFSAPAKILAKLSAKMALLSQIPKYLIEAVIFGGMLLIILYKMSNNPSFLEIIPVISLYAFAGYRLIPAIQSIYSSLTTIQYSLPTLDSMHKDFKDFKILEYKKNPRAINFKKSICLKNVYYNYPKSSRTALKNITINISAKSRVGIVGTTGCGKTTTIDIILGLLDPQKGSLIVDDMIINENNKKAWQKNIGYVPQHIFLSDDTIEANIAFGVKPDLIDKKKVEVASKIAHLHDFIINELPEFYQTKIGDRGVRLSGGQRQRIGIARALYHNPNLLILDESTNALDTSTEKKIMEEIYKIKDITIIIVSHRLEILEKCNDIIMLKDGQIHHQGPYNILIK